LDRWALKSAHAPSSCDLARRFNVSTGNLRAVIALCDPDHVPVGGWARLRAVAAGANAEFVGN
jgi:hypothetical protein